MAALCTNESGSCNRPISQIQQRTCPTSHDAPLWNRNVHISIPKWYIIGCGTVALCNSWIWSMAYGAIWIPILPTVGGVGSISNCLSLKRINKQVFPTAPSPTTTHLIFFLSSWLSIPNKTEQGTVTYIMRLNHYNSSALNVYLYWRKVLNVKSLTKCRK